VLSILTLRQEPPKLQAPLRKKKKEMFDAKRAAEAQKSSSNSNQTPDDLEKIRIAQRSMELMKERIMANYKMSKQREKQKREIALGAAVSTNAQAKKKKVETAPSYL